jgi:methionyl-tRNA formyltransferase
MRILFVGAVEFSAHALRELIAIQAKVVGVCTLTKSTFNADHFDLTQIANQSGIPVRNTPNINDSEVFDWIHRLNPDVIFCFGWSRLIGAPLLALPRLGVIGFHPAALPANRGRHPLIWALVLGLSETASTFFFMDMGADTGDILSQATLSIEPTDDAKTLYNRITKVAMEQIRTFVPRLADGSFERQPQDHTLANVWRKRSVTDGCIDWRMSAESIHNLVRGLTHPYVGAHFEYQQQDIKVWRTEIEPTVPKNLEPGKILSVDQRGILIKAGTDAIRLLDIEPQIILNIGDYL